MFYSKETANIAIVDRIKKKMKFLGHMSRKVSLGNLAHTKHLQCKNDKEHNYARRTKDVFNARWKKDTFKARPNDIFNARRTKDTFKARPNDIFNKRRTKDTFNARPNDIFNARRTKNTLKARSTNTSSERLLMDGGTGTKGIVKS